MHSTALLPGLLLARVDGKSPAEYVTQDKGHEIVRSAARPPIAHTVSTLIEVRNRWLERFP
jgi:hypothetical protein